MRASNVRDSASALVTALLAKIEVSVDVLTH